MPLKVYVWTDMSYYDISCRECYYGEHKWVCLEQEAQLIVRMLSESIRRLNCHVAC